MLLCFFFNILGEELQKSLPWIEVCCRPYHEKQQCAHNQCQDNCYRHCFYSFSSYAQSLDAANPVLKKRDEIFDIQDIGVILILEPKQFLYDLIPDFT